MVPFGTIYFFADSEGNFRTAEEQIVGSAQPSSSGDPVSPHIFFEITSGLGSAIEITKAKLHIRLGATLGLGAPT